MKFEAKIIKEIQFCDFVKCFKKVIGAVNGDTMVSYKGSRSVAAISRFLCCKMAHPESVDLFYNISDASYKNYYKGINTHKLMEKLCSERESSQFISFIEELSEDRLDILQKIFSPYIEGLEKMDDLKDIADAVTYLFNDLIIRTSEPPVSPPEDASSDEASEKLGLVDEVLDSELVDLAMIKSNYKTDAEAIHGYACMLKEASESAMRMRKPADTLNRIKSGQPVQRQDLNDCVRNLVDGINLCVNMGSDTNSEVVLSPKETAIAQLHRTQEMLNSTSDMFEKYLDKADNKN